MGPGFPFAAVVWQRWQAFFVLGLMAYVLLVSLLRHERAKALRTRYCPAGRASFPCMTTNDAQAILKDLTELEFPQFFGFSIIFALFKACKSRMIPQRLLQADLSLQTYGVPSVSSLLVSTGQLANAETASKRIADTGVLLLEFAMNGPTSERAVQAIARMNFLHSRYQKSGKITNDGLLYTLSLFALEPVRWVDKYEWRHLTELELCACGTYWKSMGDAMEIDYKVLPSHQYGWKDGLHWLKEVEQWSFQFEKMNMIPSETNKQLADSHFEILTFNVPAIFLSPCKKTIAVLLGERLRRAMLYPEPSAICDRAVNGLLYARQMFLRYLALPRPEFMRKQYIPLRPDPVTGRYNSVEYLSHPWYVKPCFKRRWGPRAWVTRLLGRKLPGDDGNRYAPEGYKFTEIGPQSVKGKGLDQMDETRLRLTQQNRGGCPFTPA